MQEPVPVVDLQGVRPSLVQLTHFIYGLHAIAVVVGITSAATVAGGFVFGLPSLVAVFPQLPQAQRRQRQLAGKPFPLADPYLLVHCPLAAGLRFADHHHHRHPAGLDTDCAARPLGWLPRDSRVGGAVWCQTDNSLNRVRNP
jgi:hypothetical protein